MARILSATLLKKQLWAGFLLVLTILGSAVFAPAQVQGQIWIQVEAKNNILETRQRAQFFAREFPDIHAFSTKSGWYVLAIGPMSRAEAQTQLDRLKRENRIPKDSFITNGATFLTQLWPLSANIPPPAATLAPTLGNRATQPAGKASPLPPVRTAAKAGPILDPDLRATREAAQSWGRDLKKQYQTYMMWIGDYEGAIDGSYGRDTRKAVRRFQTREGFEATGYLTGVQIALLKKRYQAVIARVGLETMRNLKAGIKIKYPANLVKFARFEPPFVHYSAKDGSKVRMILISQKGGRNRLNSLYNVMETLKFIPPGGYRMKKRTWFVLSGSNQKVISYTYAETADGKIKGFTLIWPPKMDRIMRPLVTAMYDSFTPLNEYVLDKNLGSRPTQSAPVDLTSGLDQIEPSRAATGFFINETGGLLTDSANVAGCTRITFGDGIALKVVATDPALSLVALRPKAAYTPKSFALFSDEIPSLGTAITAAGFSFPNVMEKATLNIGTITDTRGLAGDASKLRVSAFLENGDVGGPVLDDRGAVLGMDMARPSAKSGLPEYVNFALKANRITDFLARNKITYGTSRAIDPVAPADLAYMAGNFTAKVSCWKQ